MSARKTITAALTMVCAMAAVMVLASSSVLAAEPVVNTETPSEVTEASAVLRGQIKPEGHEITECRFEYEQDNGLPPVYDERVACQQSPEEINALSNGGTEPVAVSAEQGGLVARSKYHVRLGVSTTTSSIMGAGVEFLTTVPVVSTGQATEVNATSAVLHGTITPEDQEITGCQFEYEYELAFGFGPSYGEHVECRQSSSEINTLSKGGTEPVAVSAELSGLSPRRNYNARLSVTTVSSSSIGSGIEFYTLATPNIAAQTAVNVTSTGATIHASIESGGVSAAYRVEYGPTGSYGSSTPEVSIGAPKFPVTVEAHLNNLDPGIEYHYRTVAINALGAGDGTDSTLTPPGATGPVSSIPPDGRVDELVSPAEGSQDAYFPELGEGFGLDEGLKAIAPMRAAAGGNAVTYLGEPPADAGNGAFGKGQANQLMSTRTSNGWATTDITPEATNANTVYESFSNDLTTGILISNVPVPSSSPMTPVGCIGLYSRNAEDGSYHSLITKTGSAGACHEPSFAEPLFAGMSKTGSHLLFAMPTALTPGSHTGRVHFEEKELNLYDTVDGVTHQVNISPDGQPEAAPDASFGAPATGLSSGGDALPDLGNDISADGSRVFWTTSVHGEENQEAFVPKALYVRENDAMPQSPIGPGGECVDSDDACTLQVDSGERDCVLAGKCESGGGTFWGASTDGSRVFFTDCAKLTADSTATPGKQCVKERDNSVKVSIGSDLYEYDLETNKLTDLTIDHTGDPLGADVQGILGISEDGSYIYFVAAGSLASGAQTRSCEPASIGSDEEGHEENQGIVPAHYGCNLYAWHKGEISFIGTLLYQDNNLGKITGGHDGPRGDWRGALGERSAQVTPNGEGLVFTSISRLAGYDSEGYREVFVYDANEKHLVCASCDPSAAPPSVGNSSGEVQNSGAYLPSVHIGYGTTFMLRLISSNGSRVFFQTRQPLVPQDENGLLDVYEWERAGAGSCPSGDAKGCIYLLSGGQSADNSYLIDADSTGENVFFISREDLVPQANGRIALYDARVDGGFPEASISCTGTGCQGVPPAPPIFATPSSVTFNGVGNFSPPGKATVKRVSKPVNRCKRGLVKSHGKCVKKSKKVHKKAKKASGPRGRLNRGGR